VKNKQNKKQTKTNKKNVYWDMKCNDLWDKAKKPELVYDVVYDVLKENKLNLCNYTEFLDANKQTVISEFKQTNTKLLVKIKPLVSARVISINELITKGLDVIDKPLVQRIRDNVTVVGGFISSMINDQWSMIFYKFFIRLLLIYILNQYIIKFYQMYLETYLVRELKEIALFMLVGAPFVAGWLWIGNRLVVDRK